ncbi:MAG: type IV toxin-antitoxin system AbiEi family antitoxin domain-containing protein [Ignavibacteriaceae bacterium]
MGKINQLIIEWPRGTGKLSSSLNKMGYSKDLLKKYIGSGWLDTLGYGAFKIKNDSVGWEGALYALQTQKDSRIHAGGKTALELKGYAHYISTTAARVFLFGAQRYFLPKWFREQSWYDSIYYSMTNLFDYSKVNGFSKFKSGNFEINISSPELAAMEMLYLVPAIQTFEEAMQLMEGLTTLRPALVQVLLEKCNSLKVKRLFLYMSEKNNHDWLKNLNIKKIDFGSGKRVIVKNGVFNNKYNITVPKEYEK